MIIEFEPEELTLLNRVFLNAEIRGTTAQIATNAPIVASIIEKLAEATQQKE